MPERSEWLAVKADTTSCLLASGRAVIAMEASAVAQIETRVDDRFAKACQLILTCQGRTIVTGMGKSGHIAGKIAATFASTGTPAFFVHPGEAGHGDLGMITAGDVVLAFSNSGETEEILNLIPVIKRLGIALIALTGNPNSSLGQAACVHIDTGVEKEACPLGLAPTASTTASMAMGDAMAVALLKARGFSESDFARSHPSGRLGRRLFLHVSDIMHQGHAIPQVRETALLAEALVEMTEKGLGITAIVKDTGEIKGVFTDGDVRRALEAKVDFHHTGVSERMSKDCKTIPGKMLAAEALQLMEAHRINALLVTDEKDFLIGALNMHDLLRAKIL